MRRLDIFLLLFATPVWAADILVFNDSTGLPVCALQCSALTTAEVECAAASGSEQLKCFCDSSSIRWKDRDWDGCNDVCVNGTDRERVGAWMEVTCGSEDVEDGWVDNGNTIIGDISPSDIQSDAEKKAAIHDSRVRQWWSRNYPFFVLAFLVITIPILCYGIAIPMRRWAKRQLNPRPDDSMEDITPYKSIFASTGSRHSQLPFVTTTENGEHIITIPQDQVLVVESIQPPPSTADIEASVRQDSWEERVRGQFETERSKSLKERLMFWKK